MLIDICLNIRDNSWAYIETPLVVFFFYLIYVVSCFGVFDDNESRALGTGEIWSGSESYWTWDWIKMEVSVLDRHWVIKSSYCWGGGSLSRFFSRFEPPLGAARHNIFYLNSTIVPNRALCACRDASMHAVEQVWICFGFSFFSRFWKLPFVEDMAQTPPTPSSPIL